MKAPILTPFLLVLLASSDVHSEPATADGFVTLFNGKDLDGWTTRQPNNKDWKVVDGVIDCDPQGDASGDRNLWTTKEFGDFELWLDWRIKESPFVNAKARVILPDGTYQKDAAGNIVTVTAPNTDSGVFLRGQHKSQANIWCWPVGSGEVWGYRTDPKLSAKVQAGVTPKVKADRPIGEWNTFHIIMRGDRLTLTLNDKLVIEDAELPGIPARGPLALQLHSERKDGEWGASLVQFRNIRIKELGRPNAQGIGPKKEIIGGSFVSFKNGTLTLKRQSRLFTWDQVGANYKTYETNENGPGSKLVDTVDALSRATPGTACEVSVEEREISLGVDHRVIGRFISYEAGTLTLGAVDASAGFIQRPAENVSFKVEGGVPVLESIQGGDYSYAGSTREVLKSVKQGTILTARSENDMETVEVLQIGQPRRTIERYIGQTRGTVRGTFVSFKDGVLRILGRGVNPWAPNEYERLISLRIAPTIPVVESIDGAAFQAAGGAETLKAVKEGTIVTVRKVEEVILEVQIGVPNQAPLATP